MKLRRLHLFAVYRIELHGNIVYLKTAQELALIGWENLSQIFKGFNS
jgi:hypothetical protein